ncbi:hypothetical protein [Pseudomonas sp.]|uniref:hypothetical protein n=1 Tax=Pseudomonas sp. TaxID=306 RepID=UPI002586927F|nr:hypothetical protein [Pseudomonas sp.]
MKKSLIALSTLTLVLLSNTALAAITWPVEQTYEESLNAELTTAKCENSSLYREARNLYKINKDGTKTFINKGNGVYLFANKSGGDGFEILSDCYDTKDTLAEHNKIMWIENDVITQKCPDPTDTGLITKNRQYMSYNPDRVNSNYKIDFRITVNYACQQKLFAETVTENTNTTCPTGYAGHITNSRTYDLYTDGTKDNYSAWVKIVDTCKVTESKTETKIVENPNCATKNPAYPLGTIAETWTRTIKNGVASQWASNPFYPVTNKCYKTVTETKNPTCPAGYSGQMTQSRTYDLLKTGGTKNDTGFITTQDTCLKNESQNDECTIDTSSIPNGAFTMKGSYNTGFFWGKYGIHAVMVPVPGTSFSSNGYTYYVGAHSGADVYGICRKPDLAFSYYGYDNSKSLCPADKPLGVINTQQKYEVWTDGSIRNKSEWYETSNTCEAIKAQTVETRQGSETVSCDSYYGVQAGTYSGIVTKTGDNITIFDPASGTTNTTFQTKSEDTTSCVKEITATTKEIIEKDCPVGFSGKITSYLIKAESANGSVYPYGTTPILESNTCVTASIDTETPEKSVKQRDTVLSNLSFTTTSISKSDLIINELNKINTSNLENKGYIMNINADDLSVNVFDKNKITNLVKTFKTKLGSQSAKVKLASVPNSLEKFIGQNGLTLDRIKNEKLSMTGAEIDGGTVTVKYLSLTSTKPVQSSFTVKVFE